MEKPSPPTDLIEAVDELVAHSHDDLPMGPPSPLGGEVKPNLLKTRSEHEIRRLAKVGEAILHATRDERLAIRGRGRHAQ